MRSSGIEADTFSHARTLASLCILVYFYPTNIQKASGIARQKFVSKNLSPHYVIAHVVCWLFIETNLIDYLNHYLMVVVQHILF